MHDPQRGPRLCRPWLTIFHGGFLVDGFRLASSILSNSPGKPPPSSSNYGWGIATAPAETALGSSSWHASKVDAAMFSSHWLTT
jgi:hypothetical protein